MANFGFPEAGSGHTQTEKSQISQGIPRLGGMLMYTGRSDQTVRMHRLMGVFNIYTASSL